jgi:hypothetical protein
MKDFFNSLGEEHKEFFKTIFGSLTDLLFTAILYGLKFLRELLSIRFRNYYSS